MVINNLKTGRVMMDCNELNPNERQSEEYIGYYEIKCGHEKMRISAADLDKLYFFCKVLYEY